MIDKTPPPSGSADILGRAAADMREQAAALREIVAQVDSVIQRLAATVGGAAVLMAQIGEYQRAQRLLLDVHASIPAGNGRPTQDGAPA